ncbi:MAG: hypothetical protein WBS14_09620, partial [Rhodomicrobium sp.]
MPPDRGELTKARSLEPWEFRRTRTLHSPGASAKVAQCRRLTCLFLKRMSSTGLPRRDRAPRP